MFQQVLRITYTKTYLYNPNFKSFNKLVSFLGPKKLFIFQYKYFHLSFKQLLNSLNEMTLTCCLYCYLKEYKLKVANKSVVSTIHNLGDRIENGSDLRPALTVRTYS